MKTILVPVDFSPVTAHVVAHATELARRSGARMVSLNVTRPASMLADHASSRNSLNALLRDQRSNSSTTTA